MRKLFYTFANGGFILAPRLRAFTADPDFSREIDFQSLIELLAYGYILGDRAIFTNVKALDPGAVLEIDLRAGSLHQTRYYEPDLEVNAKNRWRLSLTS